MKQKSTKRIHFKLTDLCFCSQFHLAYWITFSFENYFLKVSLWITVFGSAWEGLVLLMMNVLDYIGLLQWQERAERALSASAISGMIDLCDPPPNSICCIPKNEKCYQNMKSVTKKANHLLLSCQCCQHLLQWDKAKVQQTRN